MFSPSRLDLGLLVLCFLVVVYLISRRRSPALPLPPGPRFSSWFGSVDLPKSYPWKTYAQWRDIYGDLIYLNVLGNPILILNSSQAISDLLEKRSANYSSRPFRTMVIDLMGWGWLFSSMPYGSWWKAHRNLFQRHFPINGNSEHRPLQLTETHMLLRNLYASPTQFSHHIRRTAAAIIVKITYGIDIDETIDSKGDNYVSLADTAISTFSRAGIFGTYLVDYIPILKHMPSWLPGASFKRNAAIWKQASSKFVNRPFDVVKQRMIEATASPCIVARELDAVVAGRGNEYEKVVRNMAATAYAGGSDTVVSVLQSLFLALVLNPHVLLNAQKELDAVIGERLPDFSDRHQLPYINCICYELLRWNPVTPLGLARCISKDDEYRGYRLPKGTTVLPNVWAVLHDPDVYPDPLTFNPDRFTRNKDSLYPSLNPIPAAAFGFGRRMCPGQWFAMDFLWIVVASVISTFDITPVLENGKSIMPSGTYTSFLLSHPDPFRCHIAPRSSRAAVLIEETMLSEQ